MELLILVGPPGSGKSTLASSLEDFVRISQDDQGKNHRAIFLAALEENKKIVVDRMNFSKAQRHFFIEEAKKKGYFTEILVLHQSRDECLRRCLLRKDHPTIASQEAAESALNTFFSKYERPLKGEVDEINFKYPEVHKTGIVCDIDGTAANIDHRLHHVRGEGRKNWKAFFDTVERDLPNLWCLELVNSMKDRKYPVYMASGRPDSLRQPTEAWLASNGFSYDNLFMRCRLDHRPDYIVKEIILDFEILTRIVPLFFIDDRSQVVNMWRDRGFVCLQCNDGNF